MAGEGAAPPRLADDVQASAMAQQHMLDDGQPQAGAAGVRGAAGVDPVEALGETRDMPGLDARAGVTHRQVRALLVAPPADVHLATVGGVLDRVEHQAGEGAAQLAVATPEPQLGVGARASRWTLCRRRSTATGRLSAG